MKSLVALTFFSLLAVLGNTTAGSLSSCNQVPQCLPALAIYLLNQENMLNTVKSDLAATKQQLQQAIGQWPPGHYCILANGQCPAGFTRSQGHLRALSQYAASASYITPAKFGDSRIQCHGRCGQYGHWIGDLYMAACCK